MNVKSKVFKLENFINQLTLIKKKNLVIGFTNGCFDLLHEGHIKLISEAKRKCNYLIIGLNSDSSIKKLKGIDRPIDNEATRIKKLSIRSEVDAIIVFSEDTPLDLIKKIVPNKLFKGSDYKDQVVVGADFIINTSGNVEYIDILEGYSTTNIIKKASN
jgi:D-beta-D-heptose 7-phosphate kinase/D-beta-D-heptose 1-phosphate adenosyltransferase